MIIAISGPRSAGKSSLAYKVCLALKKRDVDCGGLLTLFRDKKYFYRVQDKAMMPFESIEETIAVHVGRYTITQSTMQFAEESIRNAADRDVLFVDEIGILENQRKGLFEAVDDVLPRPDRVTLLVVRQEIKNEVESLFGVYVNRWVIIEPFEWVSLVDLLVDDVISILHQDL